MRLLSDVCHCFVSNDFVLMHGSEICVFLFGVSCLSGMKDSFRRSIFPERLDKDEKLPPSVSNNGKATSLSVVDDKDNDGLYKYNDDNVLIMGVAGGSGSGKTTFCKRIVDRIGMENITYLQHDHYYKDLSNLSLEERAQVNFDHPDSLDTDLLVQHILLLKNNRKVRVPVYDFTRHIRSTKYEVAYPKKIVLVEGLLIFENPSLLNILDIKIFIQTDDDIRIIRRIQRDTEERGRSLSSVVNQYMSTVRPMHMQYIEPSKQKADLIVPEGLNEVAVDLVISRLKRSRTS